MKTLGKTLNITEEMLRQTKKQILEKLTKELEQNEMPKLSLEISSCTNVFPFWA